jgi:hypothetical protein
MEILRRLSVLMEGKREHFGRLIAREGGSPATGSAAFRGRCRR